MRTSVVLCVCAAAVLVSGASAFTGIGSQLTRTFLSFKELPLTASDAKSAGWAPMGDCDNDLGTAWGPDNGKALTDHHPLRVFFTAGGQISGVAVNAFGDLPSSLIPQWWQFYDDSSHQVTVTFRSGNLCDSSTTFQETLGDRVVINAKTVAMEIPVKETDAAAAGWFKGGCITGMGTHYGFDFVHHPEMPFNGSTTVPIMPMYHNGVMSAFLVAATKSQQDLPFIGDWEGPFINTLFCKNFCTSDCADNYKSSGVDFWSTMHFELTPHKEHTCSSHC